MKINNIFNNPVVEKRVPTDVYLSVVGSLFCEKKSLIFGSAATAAAIIVTAWKTGALPLYLSAVILAIVGLLRFIDANRFEALKSTLTDRAKIKIWERRYVIGSAISAGVLGYWCFYTLFALDDSAAELIAISATVVNMIGVFGRNFGIKLLVNVQLICISVPLVVGLLIHPDPYMSLLAVMLVPFFASAKSIADRLRNTLLTAVIGQMEVSKLVQRFDTALNNMPHGLCMFDKDARLVVANEMAGELLCKSLIHQTGASFRKLVSNCVKTGDLSPQQSRRLIMHLQTHIKSDPIPSMKIDVSGNRTFQFSFRHMESGGTVVVFEDITARIDADRKIKRMARYDSLTGIPNRAYFRALMNNSLSYTENDNHCAILLLDIDEFKQVNDTFGHPTGDELLRRVAKRLKCIAGINNPVCRLGGDEFVIMLTNLVCKEDASTLAGIVIDSLQQSFRIHGHDIVVGTSIGITTTIDGVRESDRLLRNADLALYKAKRQSKGIWMFYHPDMGAEMETRLGLESELRRALDRDQLSIWFQPLVSVKSKKINTCEALIRWDHPVLGNVSPSTFIPIAEDTGQIINIGEWVLHNACIQCCHWPDDVRVAVNLSAIQFRRSDIVKVVEQVLESTGLAASRLELEITESVMLRDVDEAKVILNKFRDMGVRISLDDFGTGYSSLSYLHSLPLNKVKIDRSFVVDIKSDQKSLTMCKNITQMASQLGLSTVVEGVESEEQLKIIMDEVMVDEIQGFLFSPPLSKLGIRELVNAWQGDQMLNADQVSLDLERRRSLKAI